MAISTGLKWGIGLTATAGLLTFLGIKYGPKAIKLKNAETNLIFDIEPLINKTFIKKGLLKLYVNSVVKNLVGFDIEIENLSIILESSENGKTWSNFGSSEKRIDKVNFKDNATTKTLIAVDVKLGQFLTALINSKKYRFIINYDLKGTPLQYIVYKDVTAAVKSISKKLGLGCACQDLSGAELNNLLV